MSKTRVFSEIKFLSPQSTLKPTLKIDIIDVNAADKKDIPSWIVQFWEKGINASITNSVLAYDAVKLTKNGKSVIGLAHYYNPRGSGLPDVEFYITEKKPLITSEDKANLSTLLVLQKLEKITLEQKTSDPLYYFINKLDRQPLGFSVS